MCLYLCFFGASTSVVRREACSPSAARWVCRYQQWLKSEPGGYAFRERNSITGKWPVIETIPGIPKPTLHQCCSWHKLAFHYYCLLPRMLMPSTMHPQTSNFIDGFVMWRVQWSPEFQSVRGQLLSPSPSCWQCTGVWKHWTGVTIW